MLTAIFCENINFTFCSFCLQFQKTKRKREIIKIKQNVAANMKPLFGISCGTSIYTYHRCLHISMYCTYVYVIYTRVNLSFSPKWRQQIRVLERHTKKMKKIIKIMITKNKHKNRQLAIKMSGTTRTRE